MSLGRAPTKPGGAGGFGAGVGLVVNGANLDNQFSVGKAGGQTLLFGTATANNGIITTNPSQNGQVFFGINTNPSFWLETTTALGLDYWSFRSGKPSGGMRQAALFASRGNALNDDICIGFGPVGVDFTSGGNVLATTRIESLFRSANNCDLKFRVNIGGVATDVLFLDSILGVMRITRGLQRSFVSKSSDYTMTDAETGAFVDATAGLVTITLPTAVGRSGQIFAIKRISSAANNVVVKSAGGSLDGVAAATGIPLTAQYMTRVFQSDNVNYNIIGGYL